MFRKMMMTTLAASLLAACGGETDKVTGADDSNTNLYTSDAASHSNNGSYGDYDGENSAYADDFYEPTPEPPSGDEFAEWTENDWIDAATESTSTFSIDVDNASYTWTRRRLQNGALPEPESVRVEEFLNFFDYAYLEPDADEPFAIDLEVAPSHFGPDNAQLLRIGVKARDISVAEMKQSNIVLLIDTSGSMSSSDKLNMVKRSISSLLDNLRPTDTIGVVTYAGSSDIVLRPTPVSDRATIDAAIAGLHSGGSTNGADGIRTAYDLARDAHVDGGNNRVIIMTDGDFNVGIRGDALADYVGDRRDEEIALTAVGYGTGNFKDVQMEALAQKGNGNYFYCDTLQEAERIFGTELPSTIEIIASDVKLQVEFDPATVAEYRLVGYENRLLENDQFDDDTVDAGDVGPGKRVTAFYEVILHDGVDAGLLATGRARYKPPFGETSQLFEQTIKLSSRTDFSQATDELKFGAAVVEFAEILRHSKHSEGAQFGEVSTIASAAAYPGDQKMAEFLQLVDTAKGLWMPLP